MEIQPFITKYVPKLAEALTEMLKECKEAAENDAAAGGVVSDQ